MDCEPIGTVSTPFDTTSEAPRQGHLGKADGEIVLDPRYEPGLEGLEADTDVLVVWAADRADRSVLQVGNKGVFATRSPARPNPVCVTTCRVLGIDGRRLRIRGVDMADGSPVLDLKRTLD